MLIGYDEGIVDMVGTLVLTEEWKVVLELVVFVEDVVREGVVFVEE